MVLTIDIGNSRITVGLYGSDGAPRFVAALDSGRDLPRDRCALELAGLFRLYGQDPAQVDGAILSCVVPPLETAVADAVALLTSRRPLVVGPGIKTGLNIRSDLHNQLGSDFVASSIWRYICLLALIFTPGPMVEAVTQLLMYWPLAAAGLARTIAPMRVL